MSPRSAEPAQITRLSLPSPAPIDVGRSSDGFGLAPPPHASATIAITPSVPTNLRLIMVLLWMTPSGIPPHLRHAGDVPAWQRLTATRPRRAGCAGASRGDGPSAPWPKAPPLTRSPGSAG